MRGRLGGGGAFGSSKRARPRRASVGGGCKDAFRAALGASLGVALCLWGGQAEARPQANAGLTLGVAEVGNRGDWLGGTHFSLGGRADVLFFRERNADAGVGPYVELLTTTFSDLQVGAGASVLVPVHDYLPIVLSGGGYARHTGAHGWEPGIATSLFWGSRSYNFHASYSLAAGLLVEGRYGLGESRETAIILGAQVDLAVFALPFLIGYEAIRPR